MCRNFEVKESLALLQRFIATYPPATHLTYAHTLRSITRTLPNLPSPIRLSSTSYPETSSSSLSHDNRPPYILFEDVKLLHLRLANVEDKVGLGKVMGICKAYSGALRSANEFEENRIRVLKGRFAQARVGAKDEGGDAKGGEKVEEARERDDGGGATKGSWKKREGMRAHA